MPKVYRNQSVPALPSGLDCSGRISVALLVLFGLVVFGLFGGGWAYLNRRDLADAWRQRQVAAIPSPPGAMVSAEPAEDPAAEPTATVDDDGDPTDTAASADPNTVGSDDLDIEGAGSASPLFPESDDGSPAVSPSTAPVDSDSLGDQPPSPPAVLPTEANLNVPMVYQAPFNIWDAEHDDACEEASALMLQSYWAGELSLTRQEMEDRIFDLIDYQMEKLEYFEDTDVTQTLQFMQEHLGMANLKILPVNSLDDIRRQIAAGRPVILPADGKALQNPNFRNGGPSYHMFVVKGYTETHFIVNDPGTRRGANWLYSNEILDGAIHDWNDGDVKNGARLMIVAW